MNNMEAPSQLLSLRSHMLLYKGSLIYKYIYKYTKCPLPLSIVIRMRLVIRQSNLPSCFAGVQLEENTLCHFYAIGQVKLTDKMDRICINGKCSVQESSEWILFCIPVSNVTVFQARLISGVLTLVQVTLLWKLIRSRIWQLSHSCQTGGWSIFQAV